MESKELVIFENEKFGKVRNITQNGEPWFAGKDICDILGLGNITEAMRSLDDDEIAEFSITEVSSNGISQARNMLFVSESGLYSLIFKSRKPEAKTFRKWVTSEVLPSIRKTGGYALSHQVSNNSHENIFDRVQPLDMLDAIYHYRQAGETEKAQVLAQHWERIFGFNAFDIGQMSGDNTPLNLETTVSASQFPTLTSDEYLLTPAKIGTLLSPQISGKEVNKLLCEMELQKTDHRGYLPTEKGAAYTPGRTSYAVNLRWKKEVIAVIKEYLQNQRVDHSFSL